MRSAGDVVSSVKGILINFRPLLSFYIIFLAVCLFVYLASIIFPWLDVFLMASSATPWGVVTSIFAHGNLADLASNMMGLLSFMLVFIFTNFWLPSGERMWRVNFFTVSILSATLLSNMTWIFLVTLGSIGASGLIYASEGAVTGFCLLNAWHMYSYGEIGTGRGMKGVLLVNIFVFLLVGVWMIFFSNSFISYGRDVNVLVHGSSFMVALIFAIESGNIRGAFKLLTYRKNT